MKTLPMSSVFLQPLYLQETDHVEKKTPNPAGTPFLLQS